MASTHLPPAQPHKSQSAFKSLSDEEIDKFIKELDRNNDGSISFDELEQRLEEVHEELAPSPKKHHLNHPDRSGRTKNNRSKNKDSERDVEKADHKSAEHDGIHAFLCSLMPSCGSTIPEKEFKEVVRSWNVPSQNQNSAEDEDQVASEYHKKLSWARKARAYWAIRGPKILFICFVIALQLAFGLWQLITYINKPLTRAALGWGVIVAKGSAGVLYPTLFFMVLSMSRWFARACRNFYYLSRFVDWDRHQSFHIWMACVALFFASLHAIGHLTGTFLYGSRPAQQDDLERLGFEVPRPYIVYVRSLPGWSGLTAIGLFWTITILSAPQIRKWSYEIFQLGHLLMFPMLGLLCAHGAAKLLQYPMLGFWLAFPTLLVVLERLHRVYRGFRTLKAKIDILDDDTVVITCPRPKGKLSGRLWNYSAGQYVFLQVPTISFFQWHPFTISNCRDDTFQLHIKTDGDWTGKLRDLSTEQTVKIGIDGPFGAPAQRFYDYDRALIIGAGVGVTPFFAILADLEQNLTEQRDPWDANRRRSSIGGRLSLSRSTFSTKEKDDPDATGAATPRDSLAAPASPPQARKSSDAPLTRPAAARRVDFHWLVREKNQLLWFSSLLNAAQDLADKHSGPSSASSSSNPSSPSSSQLDLNLNTHVTLKRENISEHVFRYLLDGYRTPSHPVSALTGLKGRSCFGRPDFEDILGRFHEDVKREVLSVPAEGSSTAGAAKQQKKVGVFYCGPPVIGEMLADLCEELTRRGRADGSRIKWEFRIEVFG